MKVIFWFILAITLMVSGNATYEVLTGTVGINTWIALAAALAIDGAAIWMGHHATILAKLGDSTTAVHLATWFIIAMSLSVNFYHGYASGGLAGGLVGTIFPILSAMLFEFFIRKTIRETLKDMGLVMPAKPRWIKSRKYGDKTADAQLEHHYVALTRYKAATYLSRLRDIETPVARHTRQFDETARQIVRQVETVPATSVTDVARQIDEIVADIETPETLVALPDYLSPGMNTSQICRLLVEHDIRDIDVAHEYVNALNEDSVSRNTVRQGLLRATKKMEVVTK